MDSATTLYNQLKAAEPFFLLAGPNLIESEEHIMWMAKSIKTSLVLHSCRVGLPLVFQSSFDKANRTSSKSFRGPGMSEGLKILDKVKIAYDIPIVTNVHESIQCEEVGKVADIIQIPSFLCCQTDLLVATAKTGKIINIKKRPVMVNSVEKVRLAGNPNVMVCEREQCLDTSLLESRDVNWTYIRPVYTYGPLNYNPVEEWFFHRLKAVNHSLKMDGDKASQELRGSVPRLTEKEEAAVAPERWSDSTWHLHYLKKKLIIIGFNPLNFNT
ncbi:hypothetical protein UlMin_025265 [Ulmus minor]